MGNSSFCDLKTTTTSPPWKQKLERNCQLLKRNDCKSLLIYFPYRAPVDEDILDYFYFSGQLLQGNTSLVELSLYFLVLNEAVARSLGEGIGKSRLTDLMIEGSIRTMPEFQTAEDVHQTFCEGVGSCQTLQTVKCLYFDSESAQIIAGLLSNAPAIKTMTLYETKLKDSITDVARGVCDNSSLTSLEIFGCDVDDGGAALLANSIHRGLPILSLCLNRCFLGVVGLKSLLHVLADHPTLQTLDLSSNHAIGLEGLRMLGEFMQTNPNFTCSEVNVHDCIGWTGHESGSSNKRKEQQKAQHLAGQALLEGIQRNIHIQELGVWGNGLSSEHKENIRFYAELNRVGRHLLSTDHHVSAIWSHVLSKCQLELYSTSLLYALLREQPNLVLSKS